jgi:hypothetical protein
LKPQIQTGTDVKILKIFSPKKLAKMVFLTQTKLNFEKNDHNIGILEKRQFRQKIAENCDHTIDPWRLTKLCRFYS